MSKRPRSGEDADDKTTKRSRMVASQVADSSISSTSEQPDPEPYRYRPLRKGDIRVLVLSPGKDDEPLHGTLRRTKLGPTGIRYEAISYVWGEPVFPHPLYVDGKVLHITESLFTALREFRYEDEERILWADAVCIDQSNFEERAAQVAMMARIFNDARVLIWLGPAQAEDQLAFATINAFDNCVDWRNEIFRVDGEEILDTLGRHLFHSDKGGYLEYYVGTPVDQAISGLNAAALLLNRSWFFRVWVVQEATWTSWAFDQTICLGQNRASFQAFLHLLDLFEPAMTRNQGGISSASTDNVLCTLHMCKLQQQLFDGCSNSFDPDDAMDMVVRSGQRDCADPRDRVFSIYDTHHLHGTQSLKIDYTRSTLEMYMDFVIECLEKSEGTFHRFPVSPLLGMAGTASKESQDHGWPTWLPDFRRLTIRSSRKLDYYLSMSLDNLPYYNFSCEDKHRLSGCRECHSLDSYLVIRDQNILKTRGKIFGRVRKVAVDVDWPRIQSDGGFDFVELAAWYTKVRLLLYDVLGFDGNSRELLRLLSCGISEKGIKDVRNCACEAHIFQTANQLRNVIEKEWHNHCHSCKVISIDNFLEMCSHPTAECVDTDRHLCIFEVGDGWDFGWAPQSAQPGDELGVLSAGEHPFLLRRRTDGRYGILGDAWVLNTSLRQVLNGGYRVEHERRFSAHAATAADGHKYPGQRALSRQTSDSATTEAETDTEGGMSDSLVGDAAPMEVEDALNENRWCNAHREVPWLLENMDEIELR